MLATEAGEVGVTDALRIPQFGGRNADTDFLFKVIEEFEDAGIDWSLCLENSGGYYAISVWRKHGRNPNVI